MAAIKSEVKEEILKRLANTEKTQNVKILMAIESGSRAWGFESINSDYDVRFIYVREPDWYMSVDLESKRDVIEYPIVDEIDLNGWDIRKSLQLFWKSNPAFVEWIQSPITYIEKGDFRKEVSKLLPKVYSFEKGIYHYRSMAKTNYREHLREEQVKLKKYFYVLRPLLAIRWIKKYLAPAPIEFHKLLTLLNEQDVLNEVNHLLDLKKKSEETGLIPRVDLINQFIESELKIHEEIPVPKFERDSNMEPLNTLFRSEVSQF